ncbi:glycosyltransferase [Neolewinella lacunae]|uniref:Glycosyltransferase n=1 Tax=Neolewinella lacunae TaxID=1517758 RepID=A0A923PTS6_9BACT|nr:glycosyltransferase [Neolewinella lacunae]MBC6996682.1 glycosyltransferase [Neolewinella lacunae]MDN3633453.1 glycosyltransferase [Neolewinella lacunae]
MRIALLAPLRYPIREPFHGGLEMHTHLLARELSARGHSVTLFAHPDSDPRFRIVPQAIPGKGALATLRATYAAVRSMGRGDFDVIHNNSIHFLPPLLVRHLPAPLVTTLHTPPYRSFQLTGWLARASARCRYVAISHFVARQWAPYVGESTVVHNGLALEDWPYSAAGSPRTAVWYGRFTPEKGAEYAIAAARAAGYRLTLAGPVYDPDYFSRAIAPQLGGDIHYAGHLTQAELAALVGQAAVGLVTPVWDEPFGLAYAEMLACGTPVAGFASGAAAEIITPATGILVAKRDTAALTQVLGEVERSKDRQTCRAHVEKEFQVETMLTGYLAVYAAACAG